MRIIHLFRARVLNHATSAKKLGKTWLACRIACRKLSSSEHKQISLLAKRSLLISNQVGVLVD